MSPSSNRVFVGGLNPKVTEAELLALTSPFGKVEGIERKAGFGFVVFADASSSAALLEDYASNTSTAKYTLHGQTVNIEPQKSDQRQVDAARLEGLTDRKRKQLEKKQEAKKAKKARKVKSLLCHQFQEKGTCVYGDECRFAHGQVEVVETAESVGRKLLRDQVDERQLVESADAAVQSRMSSNGFVRPPRPVERYFTRLFKDLSDGVAHAEPNQDMYVNMHSNRLCVVGITAAHPAADISKRHVTSVSFGEGEADLTKFQVSGKKKSGGARINAQTIICTLTCSDGTEYKLRGLVPGVLVEICQSVMKNPRIVSEDPENNGFIAIIQPKLHNISKIQDSLLTQGEYNKLLENRKGVASETQEECPPPKRSCVCT